MEEIIKLLNSILSDFKYIDDKELIKEIKTIFNKFLNDENSITSDSLNYVDDKIKYLDQKYDDLYDLINLYDPIRIKYELYLHQKHVENLRKINRLKKESKKYEL